MLPEICLGVVRESGRGQDEQEREVGGGLVEDAGGVAHGDAELGRGGDVDVVIADRDVRDDAQASTRGSGLQHRAVDAVGEQAHDPVDIGGRRDQLIVRVGTVGVPLDELVTGADQRLQPAVGNPAGDENSSHGG
jgi:hypothetical protein